MRAWIIVLWMLVIGVTSAAPAGAQTASPEELRERTNAGTVGIISGGVNGTYIQIANDLAKVLDEENGLRVLPIIGKGSVQNITDILYLKGIDIGIVQSDVLEFIKREQIHPAIGEHIRYISKLYNEEFHLLGGKDIASVNDLAGRKVNFGVPGSGTYMTATTIFQTMGIAVEPVSFDQALAYEKLRNGEIAGMVYVAGKPTKLFTGLEPEEGIAFVPVPASPELLEIYLPARLSYGDYPRLIPEDGAVDTVAVGAVMAIYNWSPRSDRYRKSANFVKAFFDGFDQFLAAPRHPKWKEVNLSAVVPGWVRFAPAQTWLDARQPTVATADAAVQRQLEAFMQFLNEKGGGQTFDDLTPERRNALFLEFLNWQQTRGN